MPTNRGNSQGKSAKLLQIHKSDAKASLRRILAAPLSSLMTVFVIAVALLLPALLVALNSNLIAVLERFQSETRITLFLLDGLTEAEGIQVSENLLTDDAIESVVYIPANQALAEFSAASGFSDIVADLESNPLPATIVITPFQTEPGAVEALASRLQAFSQVALVQLDSLWLRRLAGISGVLDVMARSLGLLVIVGLCFIVGNTIRLGVENRKEEIRVIKLVGGTNGFIARPFLYAGLFYGILGGLMACGLQAVVVFGFSRSLTELAALYDSTFRLTGLGLSSGMALIVVGAIVGWFAALIASHRHIAAIDP